MADGIEIESGLLMEVTTASNTLSQTAPVQIVSETCVDETVPVDGHVAEDILQQAFVEAEDFVPNAVEYAGVVKEDTSVADEIVNNVIAEGSLVTTVEDGVTEGQVYEEYGVVGTQAEIESAETGLVDGDENLVESNVNNTNVTVLDDSVPEPNGQTVVASTQAVQTAQTGSVSVAVIPATTNLGTSHNPIRIIQQGNQYTPVQQLTAEQLQQIMQVVQQQQLAKTTSAASGSSVLFNPQTNTRIVYRVIYPSELHKNSSTASQTALSQGQPNNLLLAQQKRPYKKRTREEEEDKFQEGGPELSKEEKEERKKHRPRTRSGRVSKPPKHMMKDYKHIHVLDWDEDYDDSDGGYSDYKCSDEDKRRNEEGEVKEEITYVHPGLGSTRPKNYKCDTCEKAYIGQAGLSRHFRLYPSHGSIPEGELETSQTQDGSGRTNGSFGSLGSLSEDSNTQDSIPGMETGSGAGTPSPVAKRGFIHSGRGRGRGRHLQELSHSRRKAKLKEIVRQCEDEDLMEVVLPRLAKVITLWEFLLMKVEKGFPSRPHADDIFLQFETLHKQVQKTCQTYLTPVGKDSVPNSTRSLQIENAHLAQALGLNVGSYEVKEMPVDETSTFQPKHTPEKITSSLKPQPVRRKIHETTPNQLLGHSVAKRPKIVSILSDTSPVKSAIAPAMSVHKSAPNVQFRVVSASSSSAASLDTPHIIAVSSPHLVGLANNIASTGAVTHTQSNLNSMSNPKMVTVSTPNMTTSSAPTVDGGTNLYQQIVTVSNPTSSGASIVSTVGQPLASVRPPESSVQTSSQVGGVDKSHEILTSQAATSTMLTNNTEVHAAMDTDSASSAQSQTVTTVLNSANNHDVNSLNAIIENEPNSESITVLVNGNVTNNTQTDVQNIQVVESLEEAQQIVLAQSQLNGVDSTSNMTTLAEVVHSESEFMEQNSVNGVDVKREIVIDPTDIKQDVEGDGQVVTAEHIDGQVVTAEHIDGQVVCQDQIETHSNIYQTEDGILIIQNPDGTTFQLQGAEGIPLETVQALLAMEGQFEGGEQVQAELQQ